VSGNDMNHGLTKSALTQRKLAKCIGCTIQVKQME